MRLGFFEEYPTEENLIKLRLVNFPTSLYLGCKSINEFIKLKRQIEKTYKGINQLVYWPLLRVEEGYWFSAFSKTEAIERVLNELKTTQNSFPVLWDAELPILNKKLFITSLPNVLGNRKLIHKTLLNQFENHPLIVAEFPKSGFGTWLSELCAASFPFTQYHRLDMLYSSMMQALDKEAYIRSVIKLNKRKYKQYAVSFGLLGKGEGDPTPLITPGDLDRDLKIAKKENIEEVIIYRLGGLDKKYLEVLESYT